jgi:DNA-binding NarL/FixJ family response regulator
MALDTTENAAASSRTTCLAFFVADPPLVTVMRDLKKAQVEVWVADTLARGLVLVDALPIRAALVDLRDQGDPAGVLAELRSARRDAEFVGLIRQGDGLTAIACTRSHRECVLVERDASIPAAVLRAMTRSKRSARDSCNSRHVQHLEIRPMIWAAANAWGLTGCEVIATHRIIVGDSNKEIAQQMAVCRSRVDSLVEGVFAKAACKSRTLLALEAVRAAARAGVMQAIGFGGGPDGC